jgi:hypothetical protein
MHVDHNRLRVKNTKFPKQVEDFRKLHFEQVLLPISSENGAFCFMLYVPMTRAPDKLRICVFYAMKTSKNACIIRSECTFTHTYCCVSKLSKFGAYLYAVDDNTSCT